jgi:hypothetical protein
MWQPVHKAAAAGSAESVRAIAKAAGARFHSHARAFKQLDAKVSTPKVAPSANGKSRGPFTLKKSRDSKVSTAPPSSCPQLFRELRYCSLAVASRAQLAHQNVAASFSSGIVIKYGLAFSAPLDCVSTLSGLSDAELAAETPRRFRAEISASRRLLACIGRLLTIHLEEERTFLILVRE